ncbi:hypothetical protein [Azospirillum sp. SYSU D00513]|uniref:hypothetical protein n=1 Tax=Azospirillum sp. SYSU D00513 TaxID=2812561 RepID=UPI001B3BA191|nr:hypothetical protein [Azospirillum sp. SYSU D00513]
MADRFYDEGTHRRAKPVEGVESTVRAAVRMVAVAEGFTPIDTGDGYLAWSKDIGQRTHVMFTCNGKLDGDPEAAEWVAGRYGEKGGFVEVNGLTLDKAIEAVKILPIPMRNDGSVAESIYPSLEQAMSDLS